MGGSGAQPSGKWWFPSKLVTFEETQGSGGAAPWKIWWFSSVESTAPEAKMRGPGAAKFPC